MASTDALYVARPSTAFRFYFPVSKNDGTLMTAAWTGVTLTTSKDGAATATNVGTVTQITGLGMGFVDFTALEIASNKNISGTITVTNSGAMPTPFSIPIVGTSEIPVVVTAVTAGVIAAASFAAGAFDAVWTVTVRTLTSSGGATAADVWNYLTSAANVAGSMKEYILAKLGLITQGDITVNSPVSPNGDRLTLYQSQDYLLADGGTLPEWTSQDWQPYSLTTATSVTWYAAARNSSTVVSGAVHVISDTEIDIRTFANAVTHALIPEAYQLQIWAVLDVAHGSAQKLLVNAGMTVIDDIRN